MFILMVRDFSFLKYIYKLEQTFVFLVYLLFNQCAFSWTIFPLRVKTSGKRRNRWYFSLLKINLFLKFLIEMNFPKIRVCHNSMHSKTLLEKRYPHINSTMIHNLYGLEMNDELMSNISSTHWKNTHFNLAGLNFKFVFFAL